MSYPGAFGLEAYRDLELQDGEALLLHGSGRDLGLAFIYFIPS
jgi:hypothetical protein